MVPSVYPETPETKRPTQRKKAQKDEAKKNTASFYETKDKPAL